MAYDSNDDRSNDPKAVLRRAGIRTVKESAPGQGWLQDPGKRQIGTDISPGDNGSGWGDSGKLSR